MSRARAQEGSRLLAPNGPPYSLSQCLYPADQRRAMLQQYSETNRPKLTAGFRRLLTQRHLFLSIRKRASHGLGFGVVRKGNKSFMMGPAFNRKPAISLTMLTKEFLLKFSQTAARAAEVEQQSQVQQPVPSSTSRISDDEQRLGQQRVAAQIFGLILQNMVRR